MNKMADISSRIKIEWISFRYDYWLEMYGVKRKERRSLRRELIANMISASQDLGYLQARRNLGHVQALAHAQAQPNHKRLSIGRGLAFASFAFVALFLLVAFSNIFLLEVLTDLQKTGDLADPATASSFLGEVTVGEKEFSIGGSFNIFGWQSLTVLLAFIIGSKPWWILPRGKNDSMDVKPGEI